MVLVVKVLWWCGGAGGGGDCGEGGDSGRGNWSQRSSQLLWHQPQTVL